MITAWLVPITVHVYVPASDGSGLVIVNEDIRDGTSTPRPFAAALDDPFEKVIWCLPVPPFILWPPGPSHMKELSDRMNALISQCNTAVLSSIAAITVLELDNSSTVCAELVW